MAVSLEHHRDGATSEMSGINGLMSLRLLFPLTDKEKWARAWWIPLLGLADIAGSQ